MTVHSRIKNPLLSRIRDNLKDALNGSADEGCRDNSIDPLSISWAAKLLVKDNDSIMRRLTSVLSKTLDNIVNLTSGVGDLNEVSLKALFNAASMLRDSSSLDNDTFDEAMKNLVLQLDSNQWLSSPILASYAAYGLQGIVSDKILNGATEFIRKYFGNQLIESATRYPELMLAIPEICTSVMHSAEETQSNSLAFSAIILFVVLEQSEQSEIEWDVERTSVLLQQIVDQLSEDRQDMVVLSLTGLCIIKMGREYVYLLSREEYTSVR